MFNKGNMGQLLKQARDVQKKIEEVQNELDELIIEADSGGGMVKVVVNGKQQLLELTIEPDAIKEDNTMKNRMETTISLTDHLPGTVLGL